MLHKRLPVLLAAVAGLVATGPAPALASPADVTAAQAYIRANYALVQAARSAVPSSEAGLAAVLAQVRRECPKVAAGSPQDRDSEQLSDEVVGAIVVAGVHPDLAAIHGFIRTAGRLRWSSHRLTSTVRSYAGKLSKLSTIAAPSLCGDLRAWAASGYRTLPASSVSFDAQYTPVWVALGELPGSLAAFERPQEQGVLARSMKLERQLTEYEAKAVNTYAEILDALELKQ
jgi:hypothetical protein